jgi:hypothetical protein
VAEVAAGLESAGLRIRGQIIWANMVSFSTVAIRDTLPGGWNWNRFSSCWGTFRWTTERYLMRAAPKRREQSHSACSAPLS